LTVVLLVEVSARVECRMENYVRKGGRMLAGRVSGDDAECDEAVAFAATSESDGP
jgi:hypothetical protein